jgi:3-dehydroquinate dehydratase
VPVGASCVIAGFGAQGCTLALQRLARLIDDQSRNKNPYRKR